MSQPLKDKFIEIVLSEVKFRFDHKKIKEELIYHLDERIDDYVHDGLDSEAATQKAIDAMGNPYTIGAELNEVHKPFWGYLLVAMRSALVIVCLLLLNTIVRPIVSDIYHEMTQDTSIQKILITSQQSVQLTETQDLKLNYSIGNYRYQIQEIAFDSQNHLYIKVVVKYQNILKRGNRLDDRLDFAFYDIRDLDTQLAITSVFGFDPRTNSVTTYNTIALNPDTNAIRIVLGDQFYDIQKGGSR